MLSRYLKNLSTVMKLLWSHKDLSPVQKKLLDKSEEKLCEIAIILDSIVYWLWEYFIKYFTHENYYETGRLYTSLFSILIWKSKLIKTRNAMFLCAINVTSHYYFLIYKNNFNSTFCFGFLTISAVSLAAMISVQQIILYNIYAITLGSFIMQNIHAWTNGYSYFLNVITITTIFSAMSCLRIYTVKNNIINSTNALAARQALEAQARLAMLGQTIGGVLHEINNPLSAIILSAKMVESNISKGKLEIATHHAHTITQLSERIGSLSRSVQKFISDDDSLKKEIDLSALIEEIILISIKNAQTYGIKIEFTNPGPKPFVCNDVSIGQALLNFIDNSVFAIKDLPEKWIKITLNENNNFYNIIITDSGNGIDPKIRNSIFIDFFTTKGHHGSGLGLSMGRKIIQKYDGEIVLDEKNQNTSFIIQLPIIKNLQEFESRKKRVV